MKNSNDTAQPEISRCPFCTLPRDRIFLENDRTVAIFDLYPVSQGHALIIPKRHIGSFFELDTEEQLSAISLLNHSKMIVDEKFRPEAYTVGINDGVVAGQTVSHCHIHLIPRYRGDQVEPRGGIRWIFPDKANYWDN